MFDKPTRASRLRNPQKVVEYSQGQCSLRKGESNMPLNTKRALAESLKSLLRARPLSKITIADITDGCGISRMTFYYHFRDIYDLIDWICREEGSRAIAGRTDRETWQEGFCGLCRYVLENRSFFASVYHSISREQIENYLYSVIYDLLYRVVEEQSRGADIAEEDKRLIADFYKYGFAGAALDWLGGGMKETPEALTEKLSRLLAGQFSLAIANFSRGRD